MSDCKNHCFIFVFTPESYLKNTGISHFWIFKKFAYKTIEQKNYQNIATVAVLIIHL